MQKERRELVEQEKYQKAFKAFRYDAVRLYTVATDIRYITGTDSSNIKVRGKLIVLNERGKDFHDFNQAFRSITLKEAEIKVELNTCASFFLNDKELTSVYFNTYWSIIQIRTSYFKLNKSEPIFAVLNHIIGQQLGSRYVLKPRTA